MARRVAGSSRGDYLPQMADGIRAHVTWLRQSFPGICESRLRRLNAGETITLTGVDAWSSLHDVDIRAAELLHSRLGGWRLVDEAVLEFDPATAMLRKVDA